MCHQNSTLFNLFHCFISCLSVFSCSFAMVQSLAVATIDAAADPARARDDAVRTPTRATPTPPAAARVRSARETRANLSDLSFPLAPRTLARPHTTHAIATNSHHLAQVPRHLHGPPHVPHTTRKARNSKDFTTIVKVTRVRRRGVTRVRDHGRARVLIHRIRVRKILKIRIIDVFRVFHQQTVQTAQTLFPYHHRRTPRERTTPRCRLYRALSVPSICCFALRARN